MKVNTRKIIIMADIASFDKKMSVNNNQRY